MLNLLQRILGTNPFRFSVTNGVKYPMFINGADIDNPVFAWPIYQDIGRYHLNAIADFEFRLYGHVFYFLIRCHKNKLDDFNDESIFILHCMFFYIASLESSITSVYF